MRSRLLAAAGVAGLAAFLLGAGDPHGVAASASLPAQALPSCEGLDLRTGDLAFRMGPDLVAAAIVAASGDVSHLGVVLRPPGADPVVAHAYPAEEGDARNGLRFDSLTQFQAGSAHGSAFIARVTTLRGEQQPQMASAIETLSKAQPAFDDDFKWNDGSAMYCTEFAVEVFQQAGVELVSNVEAAMRPVPILGKDVRILFPQAVLSQPTVVPLCQL